MKHIMTVILFFLVSGLPGCASIFGPPLEPGASESEVLERYGRPTAIYQDGNETLLEYAGGYWSQYTYMARLDNNKKLMSYEQIKTDDKFASLKTGESGKPDVLKTVGQPFEVSRIHLNNYEVWSYRYKKDGIWDGLMHIMFDENAIVQKMESGLDLLYTDYYRCYGPCRIRPGRGIGVGGAWRGGGIGFGFGF